MRILPILICLCTMPLFGLAPDSEQSEYEIYKEARGHWFDNEWSESLKDFKRLIDRFPESSRRCKSESYVGYCYDKLGDKRAALRTFDRIAESPDCKQDIIEDAKSERLSLAFDLHAEDASMREILLDGLEDGNDDIRFIAAVYLSQLEDDAGLTVFFDVVENDADQDRRDTAYRHILKLGSEDDKVRLEKIVAERKASGETPKMIKLVIRNVESGKVEHKVQLPIRLFNVIIKMLREDQMDLISDEYGIDLRNLNIDLESMRSGTILFQVVDKEKNEIKIVLE